MKNVKTILLAVIVVPLISSGTTIQIPKNDFALSKLNSKKNQANGFWCKMIKLSHYILTEEKVEN